MTGSSNAAWACHTDGCPTGLPDTVKLQAARSQQPQEELQQQRRTLTPAAHCQGLPGLTILLFSSLMAFVASSGVDSCTKPTPLLAPVFWSRSTLQEMIVPNSCSTHQQHQLGRGGPCRASTGGRGPRACRAPPCDSSSQAGLAGRSPRLSRLCTQLHSYECQSSHMTGKRAGCRGSDSTEHADPEPLRKAAQLPSKDQASLCEPGSSRLKCMFPQPSSRVH